MQAADLMLTTPRRALRHALAPLLVLALAACGGGGVTPDAPTGTSGGTGGGSGGGSGGSGGGGAGASASPYGLFASTYIAYAGAGSAPFLHSIQAGDIFTGFNGNYAYGQYSSAQATMNATGLYILQAQAKSTAPTTASDYAYVAVLAPGFSGGATPTFDISQSGTLLIQMGNTYVAANNSGDPGGNAKVFTVGLNDTINGATTNSCTYNQTLTVVGAGGTGTGGATSSLGVRTYAIPITAPYTGWTCSSGSMAALESSGITTVAVTIVGSANPSVAANEFDTIAIGTIGFSGTVTAADATALAQ
jgi:hypothetical protein